MNYPHFDNKYVFANFMRHPHARRMICALMHILPEERISFRPEFYAYWSRNRKELRPLIKGTLNLHQAFRDTFEDGVESYENLNSDECLTLVAIAQNSRIMAKSGLDVSDLGSPMLKEGAIRAMFRLPKITRAAQLVLAANPNCPKDLVVEPKETDVFYDRAIALARYGNLENEETVKTIENHILSVSTAGARSPGIESLLRRKTISKLAASVMDKYVTGEEYDLLSQTAEHREYVREKYGKKDMSIDESGTVDNQLKLPPDIRAENLGALFSSQGLYALPNRSANLARIALHPRAEKSLLEAALKAPSVKKQIMEKVIGSESPHAEWFIERAQLVSEKVPVAAIATLKHTSPDGLLKAAAKSGESGDGIGLATILTHPNFPWANADQDALLAAANDSTLDVILAARALYKCQPCKEAPESMLEKLPGAMLFSPNLSARALEKLVSQHPNQAAMAACHPNGCDITVENKRERTIVEQFRAKFKTPSLAGKSELRASRSISHIVDL